MTATTKPWKGQVSTDSSGGPLEVRFALIGLLAWPLSPAPEPLFCKNHFAERILGSGGIFVPAHMVNEPLNQTA